ncbi:Aqr1p NDAI_0D01020 [Naumovozyma dairenensis CBS 421]|uniref:Major facilitator superfamily (MFS) profile domain-containing protein n=1 Tax=Naumovozyma dairenensis (strain ATCC 10597 / BCRC 20456 / CBS 421 / NBRC 0211 / NRRL Y-12639) TaxID=1071378 RepID=G0W9F4_NAUDC|nr:hypothetical protein NDAI_0D01020 [Naumovozyma dairenensis CBS 421]CCD24415.1 hypothetical protein NDAI_0D01020 [Naumovozyma dairenensis CBS 421]
MSNESIIYTDEEDESFQEETRTYEGDIKAKKDNIEIPATKDGLYHLHGTLSRTTTREINEGEDDEEDGEDSSLDTVPDEEKLEQTSESTAPYTLLSYKQKWGMVFLLVMCGFWSSLGSPIYYPALRQLEKEFNMDENKVNVTVVVYLLFQGIAPTVSGGLADVFGRRPIILGGMVIYVVASIGLACAPSYGVICFLRCIQSIGISPTIAISSGVVGDFTLKHERGTFVGATSGLVLLGQCFGSLIGAVLTARWDWRAIFWFLAIGSGVALIVAAFTLPETKRTIVGNLSIKPKNILNRAPVFLLKPVQKRFKYDNPDYETLDKTIPRLDLASAFKICALPEILLSLFPAGLQFALWTLMLSSISSTLSAPPYNYRLTIIGVCYLPGGVGGLLGSMLTGRFLDYIYKKALRDFEKKKQNGTIPENEEFNTIKVRLNAIIPQNFIAVISFLLFGWSADKGWKIPAMLITSCVSSFCAMSTLSSSTTLLVDLYPKKASTASSCFNFIRCSLSSIFMGCFAKMKFAMTVGGTFTFMVGLILVGNFLMLIPMKYGMEWRREREAKEQALLEQKLNESMDGNDDDNSQSKDKKKYLLF